MTLVVCARLKDKIRCIADTRLSSGKSTISDSGGKISVVPITMQKIDSDHSVRDKVAYTLGFAFCGSTLLANNTHIIGSNCTQLLRTYADDVYPSASVIAAFYAKVAEHVTRDTNSRLANRIFFEGIIFGYCPKVKEFVLYRLMPEVSGAVFSVKCESVELKENQYIAMGSGAQEFLKEMQTPNLLGNTKSAFEVITQIIVEDKIADVGGYPQIADATVDGVSLVPMIVQSPKNPDAGTLIINGFDIGDLPFPDGLGVGPDGIGYQIEKMLGRKALRDKGINPNEDYIPQILRNLAAFEASIRHAVANDGSVVLIDAYTISATVPLSSSWYYTTICQNCKAKCAVFIDPSSGTHKVNFQGNGLINLSCLSCSAKVTFDPQNLWLELFE